MLCIQQKRRVQPQAPSPTAQIVEDSTNTRKAWASAKETVVVDWQHTAVEGSASGDSNDSDDDAAFPGAGRWGTAGAKARAQKRGPKATTLTPVWPTMTGLGRKLTASAGQRNSLEEMENSIRGGDSASTEHDADWHARHRKSHVGDLMHDSHRDSKLKGAATGAGAAKTKGAWPFQGKGKGKENAKAKAKEARRRSTVLLLD